MKNALISAMLLVLILTVCRPALALSEAAHPIEPKWYCFHSSSKTVTQELHSTAQGQCHVEVYQFVYCTACAHTLSGGLIREYDHIH